MTLDKLLCGISMYICGCCDITATNCRIDPGKIDAEGADCIIQYALFGEAVYG